MAVSNWQGFRAWLTDAKPGGTVVYHVGELARNRATYAPCPETRGRYDWFPIEPLDSLAKYVWAAQEAGLVYLTQRPVEDDQADFINDTLATSMGVPHKVPEPRRFFYYATRSHHSAEDCGFAL